MPMNNRFESSKWSFLVKNALKSADSDHSFMVFPKRTLYVVKHVNFGQNSWQWDCSFEITIFGRNHQKGWFISMFKIGNFGQNWTKMNCWGQKLNLELLLVSVFVKNGQFGSNMCFNQLVSVLYGPKNLVISP